MNAQELFAQIRELVKFTADPGDEQPENHTEAEFSEGTLEDGTIIKWEGELTEGTAVTVVTAEGEIPAPDGTHTLSTGIVITTEGGVVTAMAEGQLPADAPEEEMTAPAADFSSDIEALRTENAALKSEIEALSGKFSKISEAMEKTLQVVESIAAAPAAEPSQPAKFSKKEKAADKAEKLAAVFNSLKVNNN